MWTKMYFLSLFVEASFNITDLVMSHWRRELVGNQVPQHIPPVAPINQKYVFKCDSSYMGDTAFGGFHSNIANTWRKFSPYIIAINT